MPERLTTQLEDGTIEKLRELAGGERKVGAFLTELTLWLFMYKDALASAPLSDFVLRHKNQTDEEYRQETADMLAKVREDIRQWNAWREEWDAKRSEDERRLAEIRAEAAATLQRMEALDAELEAKLTRAETTEEK